MLARLFAFYRWTITLNVAALTADRMLIPKLLETRTTSVNERDIILLLQPRGSNPIEKILFLSNNAEQAIIVTSCFPMLVVGGWGGGGWGWGSTHEGNVVAVSWTFYTPSVFCKDLQ